MEQTELEGNKLRIKDRSLLKLVEIFMNYTDGYLSDIITWNDLIPVVENIEDKGYTFKICRKRVEIDVDGEFNIYPKILCKKETKMQSVYNALIEFIKWYNKTI